MLSGVATSVLSTVSNLLTFVRSSFPAYSEADELEEELRKLARTVERINTTLRDAEEIEVHDHSFELWLEELRGVAYDAADILDEYRYELLCFQIEANIMEGGTNTCKRVEESEIDQVIGDSLVTYFSENFSIRGQMISKIKKIQILLDDISKDHQALRITKEDGERRGSIVTVNPPLQTSHLLDELCIFGRLDDKRSIINSLLYDMGGEGNEVDGNIIITLTDW